MERIADLVDQKGYARVSDVAEELGLTPSTVSNMVRRLAARGFVNYEKYRGFSLTAEGCSVAARIKARHETLTEFFSLLGLEPETVEAEVEDIEHHLRPRTLDVLAKLVRYWQVHPARLKGFKNTARRNESVRKRRCLNPNGQNFRATCMHLRELNSCKKQVVLRSIGRVWREPAEDSPVSYFGSTKRYGTSALQAVGSPPKDAGLKRERRSASIAA